MVGSAATIGRNGAIPILLALHSVGQQAGKDTAGDFIGEWCAEREIPFVRRSFATKMKMLVALALDHGAAQEQDERATVELVDMFKLHGQVLWWLHRPSRDPESDQRPDDALTGRDFIINLAEGCRQLFGADFWTKQVLPIDHLGKVVVITDLRFAEEATAVHLNHGRVIEIVNSRAVNPGGRSEQGIGRDSIDAAIHNEGSLDEYRDSVRAMIAILWRSRGAGTIYG